MNRGGVLADFGICGVSRLEPQRLYSLPYRLAMMEEASVMCTIWKLQTDCGDETCNVIHKLLHHWYDNQSNVITHT